MTDIAESLRKIIVVFNSDRQDEIAAAAAEETGERPDLWQEEAEVSLALVSSAADEIERLEAQLKQSRNAALEEAMSAVYTIVNVDDPPEYTTGLLDAAAAIRALKKNP